MGGQPTPWNRSGNSNKQADGQRMAHSRHGRSRQERKREPSHREESNLSSRTVEHGQSSMPATPHNWEGPKPFSTVPGSQIATGQQKASTAPPTANGWKPTAYNPPISPWAQSIKPEPKPPPSTNAPMPRPNLGWGLPPPPKVNETGYPSTKSSVTAGRYAQNQWYFPATATIPAFSCTLTGGHDDIRSRKRSSRDVPAPTLPATVRAPMAATKVHDIVSNPSPALMSWQPLPRPIETDPPQHSHFLGKTSSNSESKQRAPILISELMMMKDSVRKNEITNTTSSSGPIAADTAIETKAGSHPSKVDMPLEPVPTQTCDQAKKISRSLKRWRDESRENDLIEREMTQLRSLVKLYYCTVAIRNTVGVDPNDADELIDLIVSMRQIYHKVTKLLQAGTATKDARSWHDQVLKQADEILRNSNQNLCASPEAVGRGEVVALDSNDQRMERHAEKNQQQVCGTARVELSSLSFHTTTSSGQGGVHKDSALTTERLGAEQIPSSTNVSSYEGGTAFGGSAMEVEFDQATLFKHVDANSRAHMSSCTLIEQYSIPSERGVNEIVMDNTGGCDTKPNISSTAGSSREKNPAYVSDCMAVEWMFESVTEDVDHIAPIDVSNCDLKLSEDGLSDIAEDKFGGFFYEPPVSASEQLYVEEETTVMTAMDAYLPIAERDTESTDVKKPKTAMSKDLEDARVKLQRAKLKKVLATKKRELELARLKASQALPPIHAVLKGSLGNLGIANIQQSGPPHKVFFAQTKFTDCDCEQNDEKGTNSNGRTSKRLNLQEGMALLEKTMELRRKMVESKEKMLRLTGEKAAVTGNDAAIPGKDDSSKAIDVIQDSSKTQKATRSELLKRKEEAERNKALVQYKHLVSKHRLLLEKHRGEIRKTEDLLKDVDQQIVEVSEFSLPLLRKLAATTEVRKDVVDQLMKEKLTELFKLRKMLYERKKRASS